MSITMTDARGRNCGRLAKSALGITLLGSLVLGGASMAGAATPAGGAVRVFVTPGSGDGVDGILFTGAIGDFGKSVNIDKNGKADPNGNYGKITLKKGPFEVDLTMLQTVANNLQPTTDAMTCSASGSVTEPVTLYGGTGLYKGIAGTVNVTETFGSSGPVYAGSAKKGRCNMSDSAQPLAQQLSGTGTGTVHFG